MEEKTIKLKIFSRFITINGERILCDGTKCGKGKRVGKGWLCSHNNLRTRFPGLIKEWDFKKNEKGPENYLPRAGFKAWWICKDNPCECHNWPAAIRDRTKSKPTKCPFCIKNKPCPHNNFAINFPRIAEDWDQERNPNKPEDYHPRSDKEVWWHCKDDPCGCHRWQSIIGSRTDPRWPGNCPFCNGKPCPHNNFATHFPYLVEEWDYENNEKTPEECAPSGRDYIAWICKLKHQWKTTIHNRTSGGSGCPFCAALRSKLGYSKVAMEWLKSIEIEQRIKIQYFNPETSTKEYVIPGVGRVDGYCEENNTVYEFHGDFWHGNPNMFNPDDINPISEKTFRQLYEKTIDRDQRIRDSGYNLVTMWESDYVSREV